jgi:hypothetical protein
MYVQFLWPVFNSGVAGTELAADGPAVRDDVPPQYVAEEPNPPAQQAFAYAVAVQGTITR